MSGTFLIGLGAVIMLLSILLALVSVVLFRRSGKRIREQIKEKYGEPWKYNI